MSSRNDRRPLVSVPDATPRALVALAHHSDRRTTENALSLAGFSVRSTDDLTTIDALLDSFEPEIVVLDTREAHPSADPFVETIRRRPDMYSIVVGADSRDQRLSALERGNDDVVSSDVTPEEIALRCRSMVMRARRHRAVEEVSTSKNLVFGPLSIDTGRREIEVNGHLIAATRLEYDLFARLCETPFEVTSRAALIESVWGPNWYGDTHVVDVHLSNLRRKLRHRASDVRFMHTVRGVGFRLSDDMFANRRLRPVAARSA